MITGEDPQNHYVPVSTKKCTKCGSVYHIPKYWRYKCICGEWVK
jgi:uncharacterized OB-fold protein